MVAHRAKGERGFILLAVMWLLVLMASMVALMMLRANLAAGRTALVRDAYHDAQTREAAIETVLADRLFSGTRSAWWALPASGAVQIDGQTVNVVLSSEATRVDLNTGEPAAIDDMLRQSVVGAEQRARLLALVAARRGANLAFSTTSDVERALSEAGIAACLQDRVTIASGLTRPATGSPFDAIRVVATGSGGARSTSIVRQGGTGNRPLLRLARIVEPAC